MDGAVAKVVGEAAKARFGDLGTLGDIILELCILHESHTWKVDSPSMVYVGCNGEESASIVERLCSMSTVPFHRMAFNDVNDSNTETCMQAMASGRATIRGIIEQSNLLCLVSTVDDEAARQSIAELMTQSKDSLSALISTKNSCIATICGAIIEAATHKVPILVDGSAAIAGALFARLIAPSATSHGLFLCIQKGDDDIGQFAKQLGLFSLPSDGDYQHGVRGILSLPLFAHAGSIVEGLELETNAKDSPQTPVKTNATPVFVDPQLPEPPELRIFLTSVMFLTRLPAYLIIPDLDHNVRELVPSFCYFPIIGWGVGVFSALFLFIGSYLFHSTFVAVIVSTFASVWLTGCFHEDGVADTFDSFGGGWSKNDILRIMKDSRLGTYGCMGLLLTTLLKFAILEQLVHIKDISLTSCALIAGHVLGRYSSLFILQFYPYVEDERDPKGPLYNGIGNNLHLLTTQRVWCASIFTAISLILLLGFSLGSCVFSVGLLVSYLSGQYFAGFLGGVIGDCLGCANQVVEIASYLCIVFVLTRDPPVDSILPLVSPCV